MVDVLVFGAAAAAILAGAIGVVLCQNPVHSALSLVGTLFGVAVLFVAQEAHFLAAVQVIVYAGAIVVLFLFVIMLLGVDRSEDLDTDPLTGQRSAAVIVAGAVFAMVGMAVFRARVTGAASLTAALRNDVNQLASETNIEVLGKSIFTDYLLAFELTSALLVIAVVGAVVLARKPPAGESMIVDAPDDEEVDA